MSANTVTQAEWDQWNRERLERAQADLERTAWQSKQPKGTDHLIDQIWDLEERLCVCRVLLESAIELLNRRTVEMASLRSLIRMQVAMDAMDRELSEVSA